MENADGAPRLVLREGPVPVPSAQEVLVKIASASLNNRDVARMTGATPAKLPLVPGSDAAGVVHAVGSSVTRWRPGDRVMTLFAQRWLDGAPPPDLGKTLLGGPLAGVFAEYRVLHEDGVVPTPDYLSDSEASSLPCAAVTAWNAVVVQGVAAPGDVVVIQGTGGVALFALQFATIAGAEIVVTSRTGDKLDRARKLGAARTINIRTTPDWAGEIIAVTGGSGADLVLDLGGGDTLADSIRCARPGGKIMIAGVLGGTTAELPLHAVLSRRLRIEGVSAGSRTHMMSMLRAMARHRIRPIIDSVHDFADVAVAAERMMSGHHFGKICIQF